MGEDGKVALGDREFSPEEISSFILRELKQEGEGELGQPIRKAVITVPAFFNERQRKATQVAGELAGLEVVRIINEPTAAALAYGAGVQEGETILVYDLGGGTFDVSVVVVEQGVVEVKASHGDVHLGGDDFDDLLVEHAIAAFRAHFDLDLNGMLTVTAREKITGFAKSVTLDTRGQHGVNLDDARRNIAALVGEPGGDDAADIDPDLDPSDAGTEGDDEPYSRKLLNTARELRKRGEALLEKHPEGDDAGEIRDLIHQRTAAIKAGDWAILATTNDALSDLIFYLED